MTGFSNMVGGGGGVLVLRVLRSNLVIILIGPTHLIAPSLQLCPRKLTQVVCVDHQFAGPSAFDLMILPVHGLHKYIIPLLKN